MKPIITRQFLSDIGVTISDEEYALLEEHFETTLHERVISEVVEELTPEQAEELVRLRSGDEDTLYAWLQQEVPQMADIVSDEIDILLGEIAEQADALNAA